MDINPWHLLKFFNENNALVGACFIQAEDDRSAIEIAFDRGYFSKETVVSLPMYNMVPGVLLRNRYLSSEEYQETFGFDRQMIEEQ